MNKIPLKLVIIICAMVYLGTLELKSQTVDYRPQPNWTQEAVPVFHGPTLEFDNPFEIPGAGTLRYWLYTPDNALSGPKKPIVIHLHGMAPIPDDPAVITTNDIAGAHIRQYHGFGSNKAETPSYIIVPKRSTPLLASFGWISIREELFGIIDDLVQNGNADPQRVYWNGHSAGGLGVSDFVKKKRDTAWTDDLEKFAPQDYGSFPDVSERVSCANIMGMALYLKTDPNDLDSISHRYTPISVTVGELDDAFLIDNFPIQGVGWLHISDNPFVRPWGPEIGRIRALNGDVRNDTLVRGYQTASYPRAIIPRDISHGSSLLYHTYRPGNLEWTYSKTRDGNLYPNVWFINPDRNKQSFTQGDHSISVRATDWDGAISKVEFLLDSQIVAKITGQAGPIYTSNINFPEGNSLLQARVTDNQGKTETAMIEVKVDNSPKLIGKLPEMKQGEYIHLLVGDNLNPINNIDYSWLFNKLHYTGSAIKIQGNTPYQILVEEIPPGLVINQFRGLITLEGIPETAGSFPFIFTIRDEDGDETVINETINITPKAASSVIVSNISINGEPEGIPLAPLEKNVVIFPDQIFFRGPDIRVSNTSDMEGVIMLRPFSEIGLADELNTNQWLQFDIDEESNVYVCIEKFDNLSFTRPDWLTQDFDLVPGKEIVAETHYFDLYKSKLPFPAGRVSLPYADPELHGINFNYTVLVEKTSTTTSIGSKHSAAIKLFPNPAEEFVTIEAKGISIQRIDLMNSIGQIVKSMPGDVKTISLTGLPRAVYTIRIIDRNNSISTRKLIKM